MNFSNFKRVVVLAPHTDDGEFGCGATIAKLVESGAEVYYVAFSACEQSVLPQFPKDILISEVKSATKKIDIKSTNLILHNYEVRTFNFHRQEILENLIQLRTSIKPDLIFMPALSDIHQDHHTVAQEGLRAFKFTNILCYEVPWNNLSFNTTCFSVLSESHIQKKIDALSEYKSQAHRSYANEEFIRSLARVRGVQVNEKYAEVFDVLRLVF
ncbi:MAG: PIG-L family deacetylase [Flammeovirgaceae bacterium]|jgi:LmbE family N-acetylglucosaminyl deacetylase|nr:PIG-L family deacetylase [Flammeovirgaceae bacterium]